MKNIAVIFGTRPEAIKLAPIILSFKNYPNLNCITILTGQHTDMLYPVMDLFGMQPDWEIDLDTEQNLVDKLSSISQELGKILERIKPEAVMVQGDTISAAAAALAAFYLKIPIFHIEAGLRTYDLENPWPEEMHRQLIGKVASFHFSPTKDALQNLLRENISEKNIILSGNTIVDAVQMILENIDNGKFSSFIERDHHYSILKPILESGKKIVVITAHRRENLEQNLLNLSDALKVLSTKYPEVFFVFPVHLNPIVKTIVHSKLSGLKNVLLNPPINYALFLYLLRASFVTITDSGGIQEEMATLKKFAFVIRKVTERIEAEREGYIKVIGNDPHTIVNEFENFFHKNIKIPQNKINPYGDGNSSLIILNYIERLLCTNKIKEEELVCH